MAADLIKFENHIGDYIQTTTVYNPDVNIILVRSDTSDRIVNVCTTAIRNSVITITFKSRSLLDTFLSELDDAMGTGGSGEVTISNLGPVASTTTTSSTTTTTTLTPE